MVRATCGVYVVVGVELKASSGHLHVLLLPFFYSIHQAFLINLFIYFVAPPAVIRAYSWLCVSGVNSSIVQGTRDQIWVGPMQGKTLSRLLCYLCHWNRKIEGCLLAALVV